MSNSGAFGRKAEQFGAVVAQPVSSRRLVAIWLNAHSDSFKTGLIRSGFTATDWICAAKT
jgi:hypothetical protein